jgi:hypothetical protein
LPVLGAILSPTNYLPSISYLSSLTPTLLFRVTTRIVLYIHNFLLYCSTKFSTTKTMPPSFFLSHASRFLRGTIRTFAMKIKDKKTLAMTFSEAKRGKLVEQSNYSTSMWEVNGNFSGNIRKSIALAKEAFQENEGSDDEDLEQNVKRTLGEEPIYGSPRSFTAFFILSSCFQGDLARFG